MYKKILIFLTFMISVLIIPIFSSIPFDNKIELARDVKAINKQNYTPYLSLLNRDTSDLDIDNMTLETAMNINYNILYKPELDKAKKELMLLNVKTGIDNNSNELGLITFINESTIKIDEYLKNNFNAIEIFRYKEIGTIRFKLKVIKGKIVRFANLKPSSTGNGLIYDKPTFVDDYLEFALTNINSSKEIVTQDSVINIANTPLGKLHGSKVLINDIIESLFQFSDSQIINNPLLITNFDKRIFLNMYEVLFNEKLVTNGETKISGYIYLKRKQNTRFFNNITDMKFKFTLEGFNGIYLIKQITNKLNISSRKELRNIIASNFYKITDIENLFLKWFINYSEAPVIKNILAETNLNIVDFNSMLKPRLTFGKENDINDVEGTIVNNKLTLNIPIGSSGSITEERVLYFDLFGFKKDILINVNKNETINIDSKSSLSNFSIDEIDKDFILKNLISFEQTTPSNIDGSSILFSTNISYDTFIRNAVKEYSIFSTNLIQGSLVFKITLNDSINVTDNSKKEFTFNIKGFKSNVKILNQRNYLDIKDQQDLQNFEFIKELDINNVANTNAWVSTNQDFIIDQLFMFEYDSTSSNKLFTINCTKEFFRTNIFDSLILEYKNQLGIIKFQIKIKSTFKGLFQNGLEINDLSFNVIGYEKEFKTTLDNKIYYQKNEYPLLQTIDNIDQDNIFKSLIMFNSAVKNNNYLLTTSISDIDFKQYFLKSISINKEKDLGLVNVNIQLVPGFIDGVTNIHFVICGYDILTPPNELKVKNIDEITKIPKFKDMTPSIFTNNDVLDLISYSGLNQKYSILDLNCARDTFEQLILNDISIEKTYSSAKVILTLKNSDGSLSQYISMINGFNSDLNIGLIVGLPIAVIVIIVIGIIVTIYLCKRKKIMKEMEE